MCIPQCGTVHVSDTSCERDDYQLLRAMYGSSWVWVIRVVIRLSLSLNQVVQYARRKCGDASMRGRDCRSGRSGASTSSIQKDEKARIQSKSDGVGDGDVEGRNR